MTGWLRERDGAVEVAVKAVPNASRDRIVGLHGDRLKVAVAAPPEKGKANDRIAQVLAQAVGVATRQVTLVGGGSAAQKTFAIRGASLAEVQARLLPAAP